LPARNEKLAANQLQDATGPWPRLDRSPLADRGSFSFAAGNLKDAEAISFKAQSLDPKAEVSYMMRDLFTVSRSGC